MKVLALIIRNRMDFQVTKPPSVDFCDVRKTFFCDTLIPFSSANLRVYVAILSGRNNDAEAFFGYEGSSDSLCVIAHFRCFTY